MHRRVLAIAMGLLTTTVVSACAFFSPSGTPAPSGPIDSPLPAGSHTSTVFQPAVTFTVPDGWVLATDSADYLQLRPANQELLGIHVFRGVVAASQDASCPVAPAAGVGSSSTELVAWIRDRKGLVVSSPALVTVGGLPGAAIDIGIADGWTASCPFANGSPSVPLLVEPGTGLRWVVAGGERLRMYFLDLPGGGTVIVDIDDFDGSRIDTFLGAAVPIVKSFAFASS